MTDPVRHIGGQNLCLGAKSIEISKYPVCVCPAYSSTYVACLL